MIETYAATEPENFETPAEAAQGGRIGFNSGGFSAEDLLVLKQHKYNPSEVAKWKDGGRDLLKTLKGFYTLKAQGGRIGYNLGGMTEEQDAMIRDMLNKGMDSDTISTIGGVTPEQIEMIIRQINEAQRGLEESGALENIMNVKAKGGRIGAQSGGGISDLMAGYGYDDAMSDTFDMYNDMKKKGLIPPTMTFDEFLQEVVPEMSKGKEPGRAMAQTSGLMNLGGNEMDLRGGGFVPIGEREKADDVPARLSKNEFVFTADAVRAAGGGDVDAGADKMYRTMKDLEGMVA